MRIAPPPPPVAAASSCLRTCAPLPAAVILGGGAGTRLYPLTKNRAKPAVPIGGAYRLVRLGGCLGCSLRSALALNPC